MYTEKRNTRKRRDEKNSDYREVIPLTKEQLQLKLRDKLKNKQTSRLSRVSRDNLMDKLENKIKDSKGKDIIKLKKQIKDLKDIYEKEINNEVDRTIPEY